MDMIKALIEKSVVCGEEIQWLLHGNGHDIEILNDTVHLRQKPVQKKKKESDKKV